MLTEVREAGQLGRVAHPAHLHVHRRRRLLRAGLRRERHAQPVAEDEAAERARVELRRVDRVAARRQRSGGDGGGRAASPALAAGGGAGCAIDDSASRRPTFWTTARRVRPAAWARAARAGVGRGGRMSGGAVERVPKPRRSRRGSRRARAPSAVNAASLSCEQLGRATPPGATPTSPLRCSMAARAKFLALTIAAATAVELTIKYPGGTPLGVQYARHLTPASARQARTACAANATSRTASSSTASSRTALGVR